ncbi:Uma2 family endonuclease [Synechococcus sp. C9]|uniref:Uma2 family endonuclease n=1 Tax=Synechococcus sp. C9 TaxID=102119 RepID=UPI001FF24D31|nr:Uma2 family endonuclease [Synechococcus sp. C9]
MAQTQIKKYTFAEFLDYDAEDDRVELEDGKLIIMSTASPQHIAIIRFLYSLIQQYINDHNLSLEIFPGGISVRTGIRSSREPDLCILHREEWEALRKQNPKSAIVERPLLLVIEVVSPRSENQERDYQKKREEYLQMGIPEYWIIDAEEQKVTVCLLKDRSYTSTEYMGQALIRSGLLTHLALTVEQLSKF